MKKLIKLLKNSLYVTGLCGLLSVGIFTHDQTKQKVEPVSAVSTVFYSSSFDSTKTIYPVYQDLDGYYHLGPSTTFFLRYYGTWSYSSLGDGSRSTIVTTDIRFDLIDGLNNITTTLTDVNGNSNFTYSTIYNDFASGYYGFYLNGILRYDYTLKLCVSNTYNVSTESDTTVFTSVNSFRGPYSAYTLVSTDPDEHSSYLMSYQIWAYNLSNVTIDYYELGYQDGYTIGYDNGTVDSSTSSFNSGYSSGYDSGYANGYSEGVESQANLIQSSYSDGYSDGYEQGSSQDETVSSIFSGILQVGLVPINFFLALFNFEILGINLSGFIRALFTVAITVIIIRVVLGGKGGEN